MDRFNNQLAIEPYGKYSFILGQTTKCIMGTIQASVGGLELTQRLFTEFSSSPPAKIRDIE